MASSGQTLNDRINAARYALAGQGLARCVCKATTEEVIGPKKKHLDYLLACTHEPNVSIPQLANLLIERTNHIYWVVVFKALVTVHHLMSYGNERFTQYLASSNYSFELSTFLDKTAARDFSMSTYIRRYSRYINEKALSYRLLAFDFCKVKRGNEGVLRIMPIDRLLKTLPILQSQLDALLEFDCSANDLNNGVINACFMLLFRDLIGLFACHNDGIINLLNKYFTLNRKMCREAFDLYKKFLVRMDKVSDFLRVAEVVGIDKDEIPDLRRAPSSLIDSLEQHLLELESNKKILRQSGTSANNNNNGSTSNNNSNSKSQTEGFSASFKDEEVRKALEEEARVLSQYGTIESTAKAAAAALTKLSGPTSATSGSSTKGGGGSSSSSSQLDGSSPKFSVQATTTTSVKSIDDIFGDADSFIKLESKPPGSKKASDDLFGLLDTTNPPPTNGQSASTITSTTIPTSTTTHALKPGNPFPDIGDDFASAPVMPSQSSTTTITTNNNNSSVFKSSAPNYTNLGGLEGFGDLLQPMATLGGNNKGNASAGSAAFGSAKPSFSTGPGLSSTGLFKGDLDSTLANLAQNLTFDGISKNKK